jgi:hypothetical protein
MRPARYNGHGAVWCFNCRQYLPAERFRWANPPSWKGKARYWSYCRECEQALDRLRLRNIRGTDAWQRDQERRGRQQRAQNRREREERIRFAQDAIGLLRRRGLTKSEIARLTATSLPNLLQWERGTVRCDPNVAARLGELLLATADWPLADEPAYRRRLPHPELPRLMARMAPVIREFPVRSRWKDAA